MIKNTIKSLLFVAVVSYSQQAYAQSGTCLPHQDMVKVLNEGYEEIRRGMGIAGTQQKAIMELFISNAGTWTAIITTSDGMSCIIAAGVSYMEDDAQLPPNL